MQNLISLLGVFVILGIGVALSTDRRAIRWKTIGWGLGIQFVLALFILKTEIGRSLFQKAGDGVTTLLHYSHDGASFVFRSLVTKMDTFGFLFAFQVLPTIVFVASLISVLYYIGLVPWIVSLLAKGLAKTMGTSGAESLSCAACVFVGQVEGPLLVRPYIEKMTRSELMALMTGGMATIAGGVLAAYLGMLGRDWAPALLAASIMGAPAGLVMAKLIVPETEEPDTMGEVKMNVEKTESSIIEAAARGAGDGMHLSFNIAAMLIAFISLIALINGMLSAVGGLLGASWLTMETLLGWAFAPLAFVIGVPWEEVTKVSALMGKKIVLNEFVAYADLSAMTKANPPELSQRAALLASFALCGFANFSSIAQNVGGIGTLAPSRRGDLARLGLRAMAGGALASMLSASIAGLLTT